jgi:hypothetical protein
MTVEVGGTGLGLVVGAFAVSGVGVAKLTSKVPESGAQALAKSRVKRAKTKNLCFIYSSLNRYIYYFGENN